MLVCAIALLAAASFASRTVVAMVQLVESVDWSNHRASIKLVGKWDLSRWPASQPPPR